MLQSLTPEKILQVLLKRGGEFADIFFEETTRTAIVCEDRRIERLEAGMDRGLALRLIADKKSALAHTNNLELAHLLDLAEGIAQFAKPGVGPIGASPTGTSPTGTPDHLVISKQHPRLHFPILKEPASTPLKEKLALLRDGERLAWSLDTKIVQVRLTYADVVRETEIASCSALGVTPSWQGQLIGNRRVHTHVSVTITTSDGDNFFTGYDSHGGHVGFECLNEAVLDSVIRKATHRALLNLQARRAQGGVMPVIIASSAGGTLVHEAVGHGLEADHICDKLSAYAGRLGEKIASEQITVIDDPTLPEKRGSYALDDEGVEPRRTVLIEQGMLKDFMFDRLSALKMGTESNGHGRRESYRYRPVVRMSNTMIAPGNDDPETILKSLDRGLFVAMMGGGQVNTVNGDFVFEVTEGYRIENGKIGEPVRGATLTGNGPEILKQIDRVGSDLGFSTGTCGKDGQNAPVSDAMPTIRIPEMVVGGLVET